MMNATFTNMPGNRSAAFRGVRSEITAVYVVDARGGISLRQVRLGHRFDERIEVAGLKPGETIALDPVVAAAHLKPSPATDAAHE
jgi:hypothetical protein